MLDHAGLRMEIVASTDRRVDRVRVFPPATVARTSTGAFAGRVLGRVIVQGT